MGNTPTSFPAFPMSVSGSFSHWMAALEQRNRSGRGDIHWREFILLVFWLPEVCARAEDVWVQHAHVCTVPATDA